MDSNGLSLCGTHKTAYNPYWKERHRIEFKNACTMYLPKDWIPEEKFIDVMINHGLVEPPNTIMRPIEFDEEEVSDNTSEHVLNIN